MDLFDGFRMAREARGQLAARADGRPPPGSKRDFRVNPGAITAGTPYVRIPADDGVPRAFYRCNALVVRNQSAAVLAVTINGILYTVPARTTDELRPADDRSEIEAYSIDPTITTTDGQVRVIEKCVAYEGVRP